MVSQQFQEPFVAIVVSVIVTGVIFLISNNFPFLVRPPFLNSPLSN